MTVADRLAKILSPSAWKVALLARPEEASVNADGTTTLLYHKLEQGEVKAGGTWSRLSTKGPLGGSILDRRGIDESHVALPLKDTGDMSTVLLTLGLIDKGPSR